MNMDKKWFTVVCWYQNITGFVFELLEMYLYFDRSNATPSKGTTTIPRSNGFISKQLTTQAHTEEERTSHPGPKNYKTTEHRSVKDSISKHQIIFP